MPTLDQQRTQKYLTARQQHPAWLLLASRRAPLVLSCLDALFEHQRDGVPFDATVQALADMLAAHANDTDFEIDSTDTLSQARREVREWIRRGLVVEREGRVFETDALKTALRFITQLDGRMMTSTASRLAVVGELLSYEPYAVMFRKADPQLAKLVTDSMRALARDGEIDRQYRRWFLQKLPGSQQRLGLPMSAQFEAIIQSLAAAQVE